MKIKELEKEIKLLQEYKELLEKCIELDEKLNNKQQYIPIPEPYPVYPYPWNPNPWYPYTFVNTGTPLPELPNIICNSI